MNVGLVKTVSYLSSFALLGGVAYVAFDYYTDGRTRTYFEVARAEKVLNGVEPPAAPRPAALVYETDIRPAVVNFDWTGRPPAVVEEVDPSLTEDVVVQLTPVSEVLEVLMVLVDGDDPGQSLCLVRLADPAAVPQDRWFAIGSTAASPDGEFSVYRITSDGVEFSFADDARAHEFLSPSARRTSGLIVSVPEGAPLRKRVVKSYIASTADTPEDLPARTERRNGQYYLGTEDAAAFASDYQSILSQDVRTRTFMKDGKRAGVELTEVKEGSIAARHGARSGDVVISINGTPVSSQQEAISFAKANSDRYSVWTVEVLRLGRVETVVYHSPGS